ncbi:putative BRO1 domain-containing protein BROX [Helianthus debilis subsp. tardiflorus]
MLLLHHVFSYKYWMFNSVAICVTLKFVYYHKNISAIDILLKATGYHNCAVRQMLPQFPSEHRRDMPVDLAKGVLRAICLGLVADIAALT